MWNAGQFKSPRLLTGSFKDSLSPSSLGQSQPSGEWEKKIYMQGTPAQGLQIIVSPVWNACLSLAKGKGQAVDKWTKTGPERGEKTRVIGGLETAFSLSVIQLVFFPSCLKHTRRERMNRSWFLKLKLASDDQKVPFFKALCSGTSPAHFLVQEGAQLLPHNMCNRQSCTVGARFVPTPWLVCITSCSVSHFN